MEYLFLEEMLMHLSINVTVFLNDTLTRLFMSAPSAPETLYFNIASWHLPWSDGKCQSGREHMTDNRLELKSGISGSSARAAMLSTPHHSCFLCQHAAARTRPLRGDAGLQCDNLVMCLTRKRKRKTSTCLDLCNVISEILNPVFVFFFSFFYWDQIKNRF